MKISILNSSPDHPVNTWLYKWVEKQKVNHCVDIYHSKDDLIEGDLLFLISCSQVISEPVRKRFKKTLVIHASDLPKGRGWSPHIWELINGAEEITLSLLEAEDNVDSGNVWRKIRIKVPKTALYQDINKLVFNAELELMDYAVENFHTVTPSKQANEHVSYWPKRNCSDSELDIHKSLDELFDLIRVCDSERFPAFFVKYGKKFKLKIENY